MIPLNYLLIIFPLYSLIIPKILIYYDDSLLNNYDLNLISWFILETAAHEISDILSSLSVYTATGPDGIL